VPSASSWKPSAACDREVAKLVRVGDACDARYGEGPNKSESKENGSARDAKPLPGEKPLLAEAPVPSDDNVPPSSNAQLSAAPGKWPSS
jgi:hypothetical protein